MTQLFKPRDTLTAAHLGLSKPTTPAATWRGYGIESGTNDRVFLKGTSRADIEKQANGRAYRVKLMQIWRVEE